ncbi:MULTISPECIES: hypothetical protein [Stenotrophomonas]|uniref:hypothetical protein n=1 Tax=Stenotrophomonas TaxID=40323 RepID=UPI000871CBB4|nr:MULTISPECIES: hypothetical protein [Stenotrophomonas]OEZ02288.1 hypothetical protein BIY45_01805 [Stenotrophomonas sp. BIIR7]
MSAQILSFPVRDEASRYRLQSVRQMAARAGADVHKVELEFIAAGCTKDAQNKLSERYRRRFFHTDGPEAA